MCIRDSHRLGEVRIPVDEPLGAAPEVVEPPVVVGRDHVHREERDEPHHRADADVLLLSLHVEDVVIKPEVVVPERHPVVGVVQAVGCLLYTSRCV